MSAEWPLNKFAHLPQDEGPLAGALTRLDRFPQVLAGQHDIRRWEYALALHAIDVWDSHEDTPPRADPLTLLDVGGAGSGFWRALASLTRERVVVIDPGAVEEGKVDGTDDQGFYSLHTIPRTVEQFAGESFHEQYDVITAISVIEHVPEPLRFLRACRMLLKPGGLLVLTTDAWDSEGPDVAHFHWMRERIYNPESLRRLRASAADLGFKGFGRVDLTYPGPMVYDYSVASLTATRKMPTAYTTSRRPR